MTFIGWSKFGYNLFQTVVPAGHSFLNKCFAVISDIITHGYPCISFKIRADIIGSDMEMTGHDLCLKLVGRVNKQPGVKFMRKDDIANLAFKDQTTLVDKDYR